MNLTMLGNAEASTKEKVQSKILSAKKEVMCSNLNIKQKKFARKLKGLGPRIICTGLLGSPSLENILQLNQIEESYMNLVPDKVIVEALMAPDRCPWTRGRKSIASAVR
jgi:euchromatic histone-lysine N-methyltransferase